MIWEFLEEYKWVIIIVMIAFFMAYFMGFTISTIVNYRLRDALLNIKLPRPKVIIKESFTNSNENLPKNKQENSESNGTVKVEEKVKGCKTKDETLTYANNYKKVENLLNEQSPYMAANSEDIDDAYMDFE